MNKYYKDGWYDFWEEFEDSLEKLIYYFENAMTKDDKLKCETLTDKEILLFVISEYNSYIVRNGLVESNGLIFPSFVENHRNSDRLVDGGMALITNPEALSFHKCCYEIIATEVEKWLIDYYKQEEAKKDVSREVFKDERIDDYRG